MAYRRGRRRRSSYSTPPPTSYSYQSYTPTPPPTEGPAAYFDGGSIHDAYKWYCAHQKDTIVTHWTSDRHWATHGLTDEQIVDAGTIGLPPDPVLVPSETESDWLPQRLAVRLGKKKYWGVGPPLAWNVPSLIAGTPDYALRVERRVSEGAVVSLIASGTVSAGVPADDLVRRAAAICNAVRDIGSTGRGVEVWLSVDLSGSNGAPRGTTTSVRVKVKGGDEAVDTALLFFWLGHPAALRGILYPYAEYVIKRANGERDGSWTPEVEKGVLGTHDGNTVGYCSPVEPVRWPDDPGTAVLPCVYTGDPDWQARIRTVVVGAFSDAPTE